MRPSLVGQPHTVSAKGRSIFLVFLNSDCCLQLAVILLDSEKTGYAPQWNFWKYLVDHRGNVVGPWGPQTSVSALSAVVGKAISAARWTAESPFLDNDSPSHPNRIKEL